MTILLIDIGNTSTDFRYYDKQNIIPICRLKTKSLLNISITELVNQLNANSFDQIVYACVCKEIEPIIQNLAKFLEIPIKKLTNKEIINDHLDVKAKNELGGDLVAFYLALIKKNINNCICISMGTTTTFTIIKNKKIIGVVISPGIYISQQAIINNTDLDSVNYLQYSPEVIGNTTDSALSIGLVNIHQYGVERLIKEIQKKYSIDRIIFTGGNSFFLQELIKMNNYDVIEDLIFQGLVCFFNH